MSSLRKIKKNEKTSKKRRIDTYFLRSLCMVIGVLGLYCIFYYFLFFKKIGLIVSRTKPHFFLHVFHH